MSRVVVIGAGHNGLVCACYLARAGHDVTVVEQAPAAGGCALTEQRRPGFRINTGAVELEGIVHSGISSELELEAHGLEWLRQDHLLVASVGDEVVALHRDLARTVEAIGSRYGRAAAASWQRYAGFADAMMALVGTMQHVRMPEDDAGGGLDLSLLGGDAGDALKTMMQPATVVVRRWLDHPVLQAAANAYATHPQAPPYLPGGGVLGCLLGASHGVAGARPRGGSGRLIEALVAALEAAGGAVRSGVAVTAVNVEAGRCAGVTLADGERLDAAIVISTIDILRLAPMLPPGAIPPSLAQALRSAHSGLYNVGELKVDLALARPPAFPDETPGFAGALRYLVEDADHHARHFNLIGAGLLPDAPPLMAVAPCADDPTLAPPGQSTLWLSTFVPARPAEGGWPGLNERATEQVLATLERHAPGTREHVLDVWTTGPAEWEARTGNPAGNPNHIDMSADQLLMLRPGVGLAEYASGIPGVYLSGAGTSPGGGVHGMPGKLAAHRVLSDLAGGGKRRSRPSLLQLARTYFKFKRALR